MQTTVIWLSLFVLFLVIEIITMGLTTIWFAGGALVAFLVAVLGLGLGVQIICNCIFGTSGSDKTACNEVL
jgi:membrane protein implicated in regulation of membrane protease activity